MAGELRRSKADKLELARILIEGGRSEEVGALMAPHGYPAERVGKEGGQRYEHAERLNQLANDEQGQAVAMQRALDEAEERLWERYNPDYKLGQAAFEENPHMLIALDLVGRRKSDLVGRLRQADNFYDVGRSIEDARAGQEREF
jgi:hypothetical protein